MDRVQVLGLAASLVILFGVVELVRSGRLKEKYSLLWLFTAVVLLVLAASKGLMARVSEMMGIFYPPSAFFLLAFIFLTLITMQFSVVISKLSERNKALAQELAIIKSRLTELEKAREAGG